MSNLIMTLMLLITILAGKSIKSMLKAKDTKNYDDLKMFVNYLLGIITTLTIVLVLVFLEYQLLNL